MIEQGLLIIGVAIFGVLGAIHLIFTFFSNRFNARDNTVTERLVKIALNESGYSQDDGFKPFFTVFLPFVMPLITFSFS